MRACSKGLKGFLRWIEALIQEIKSGKKGKSMEELLEDAERTVDDLDELFEISQIDKAIEELGITIKVPKNALNAVESAKKLELVTAKLKKAIPPKIFDPNKAALKKLGIKLPASKAGLSVDFSNTDYLYKAKIGEKSIVKIKLTGHDDADVLLSSKLAGLTNKPKNYTWHHLDDYNPLNGTCSMQLVETSIHIKCNPHVGGVKVLEDFLSFKYLTRLN